jgi:protein O-GlcNAc transferase
MKQRLRTGDRAGTGSLLLPAVLFLLLTAGSAAATDDYARAASLVRNHQWDAGLALLDPMLRTDPRNLQVLNLAGLAFTGKGETRKADELFERALAIAPGFLPALKNLAVNEFNAGDSAEAEHHLALALKQSPDDPVANLYAGQLAYSEHNFARAAETLPKAEPFLLRDANLTADLAISYLYVGRSQDAAGLLATALPAQLTPEMQFLLGVKLADAGLYVAAADYLVAARAYEANSFNASFDLAFCYLRLRRYADAASVLRETAAHGHETSEMDNLLAEAYEDNHQTQAAIDALRRAIALAPKDENNYLDFASLCINHQDYPAALQVLTVGLRVQPNSDRLFFERGILHAVQDNFQLAEEDFKHAAALSPEKNSNYKGLGILYLESGNAAQAVTTLRRRLRVQPDDPDLAYLLGEALLRSGAQPGDAAYREAQDAFEKSVRLNPKACLPHVSLGKMYLEQGRAQAAVTQLEAARAADPTEKSTYWQLANAYRKLGEPEKQKAALQQLQALNLQERSGPRGRGERTAALDNSPPVAPK